MEEHLPFIIDHQLTYLNVEDSHCISACNSTNARCCANVTASDNRPHVRGADVKLAAHYCQSGGTAAKRRGRKTQHYA